MEEKDIIRTEENSLQQTGALAPDGSVLDGASSTLPVRSESVSSGNISNAFLSSMTATSEGIHKKYPNLQLTQKESMLRTNKEGEPVRYTRRQKLTLLALAQELSRHTDEKDVKELLERMDKANTPDEYKALRNAEVKVYINLEEVCRLVDGDAERWRVENQEALKKELDKISDIRQLYLQDIVITEPDGNKGEKRKTVGVIKEFISYFYFTKNEKYIKVEDRQVLSPEIAFKRVFFDGILDRYSQLPIEAFQQKNSKGRRLSNDVYLSLLLIVMPLRWAHAHWNYHRAKDKIMKQDIIDPEKKERILEEALTHTPISFDRIKDITEKDYNEHRQMKARFKEYLWEAMQALIRIGVLLEKSSIDWEKETITLVYNPDYATPKQRNIGDLGGEWNKNPFGK